MKKIVLLSALAVAGLQQVSAQCPTGETQVTMAVVTDRYGGETTWSITGPGGAPVYATGGPYTTAAANGEYPQTPESFCVVDGSIIEVTVNDAYGDGMCCAYGNGSWDVSANGNSIASGGTFTTVQGGFYLVGSAQSLDMASLSLDIDAVVAQGNQTVTGKLGNFGTMSVSSFDLNYRVDGGATLTEAVTANVASGGTYTYAHSTPWNAVVGGHMVEVWASNLNGSADGNTANDLVTANINVATQSVQRTTVMEEFGSSTCPPCFTLSQTLSPTLSSLNTNHVGSNVSAVGYAMDWPSPGNDPSFNPDGDDRRGYYGVTGIPNVFLDGKEISNTAASVFTDAAAVPAFMNVEVTHTLNGNMLDVTTTVTPFADFPGSYKLHMVITEDFYTFAGNTTGQSEYHYIQRKMLPNANGTTVSGLTAGVAQTFTESYTLQYGGVAQGNHNLWSTSDNVTVVSFLQNNSSKEVYQAGFSNVDVVGVNENELDNNLSIYPNPTNGQVIVEFTLSQRSNINMQVHNMIGELVLSQQGNSAERQNLDLSALNNGVYYVSINAGELNTVRKVILNK